MPPNDSQNEHQWLMSIAAGGSRMDAAVRALFDAYRRRFFTYFVRNRMPEGEAEELVQEVFMKIVRGAQSWRGDTPAGAWIWAVARNALTDRARRFRPEQPLEDEHLEKLEGDSSSIPGNARETIEDCVERALLAFSRVEPERAEVVRLQVTEEWSIVELATFLGRTPGATREYVSQCRKKLKQHIAPCHELLES